MIRVLFVPSTVSIVVTEISEPVLVLVLLTWFFTLLSPDPYIKHLPSPSASSSQRSPSPSSSWSSWPRFYPQTPTLNTYHLHQHRRHRESPSPSSSWSSWPRFYPQTPTLTRTISISIIITEISEPVLVLVLLTQVLSPDPYINTYHLRQHHHHRDLRARPRPGPPDPGSIPRPLH